MLIEGTSWNTCYDLLFEYLKEQTNIQKEKRREELGVYKQENKRHLAWQEDKNKSNKSKRLLHHYRNLYLWKIYGSKKMYAVKNTAYGVISPKLNMLIKFIGCVKDLNPRSHWAFVFFSNPISLLDKSTLYKPCVTLIYPRKTETSRSCQFVSPTAK